MYALRDVTATVDSLPLIASSVMSKKLAGGAPSLVLDVKVGRGAFMRDLERARALTALMIRIGEAHGRRVHALLTQMDQPLGYAVGNAVEVNEAAACLRGEGPPDLAEEVVALSAHMVALARGLAVEAARERVTAALARGDGYATLLKWVAAQGGDARALERGLPLAPAVAQARASLAGYVRSVDALAVGRAVLALGAGRERLEDTVNPSVGARVWVKVGDRVAVGQELADVYATTPVEAERAARALAQAIEITDAPVARPPAVLAVLGEGGHPIAQAQAQVPEEFSGS